MNRIIVLCLAILLASPLASFANPTEATLDYVYSSNGSLRVNIRFDDKVSSRACRVRYRGSLYYEDYDSDDSRIRTRGLGSRILKEGRASSSLRPRRISGVLQRGGQDPILSLQASFSCPGQPRIFSNAVARFIKCGAGVKRVSTGAFFRELKDRLRGTS